MDVLMSKYRFEFGRGVVVAAQRGTFQRHEFRRPITVKANDIVLMRFFERNGRVKSRVHVSRYPRGDFRKLARWHRRRG